MSRSAEIKDLDEFPRRIKIFFVVITLLFITGTIGFSILTESTIKDSAFRALQTLAFMFDEESSTPERFIEIFLAIFGVFIVWWVLWSVADMVLEGNLTKYIKRGFYSFKIQHMKNHTIIIGGGRVGEEIAKVLSSKNKEFLIIDSDPKTIASLKNKKYIVIEGDALEETTLKNAGITTASKIVMTLPRTESNIMITISAKELNPKIEVHSRCENSSLVSKLKKVGAKVVVVPELVAADTLAKDLEL